MRELREPPPADGAFDAVGGGMALRSMAKAAPPDGAESVLVDLTDEDVEVTAAVEMVVAIAGG